MSLEIDTQWLNFRKLMPSTYILYSVTNMEIFPDMEKIFMKFLSYIKTPLCKEPNKKLKTKQFFEININRFTKIHG